MRRTTWTILLTLTAAAAFVWAPRDIARGRALSSPNVHGSQAQVPARSAPALRVIEVAKPSTIPEVSPVLPEVHRVPVDTPPVAPEVPESFWIDAVDCGMG